MLQHIGIIMDGNRRWAKSKFMPASYGHKKGADNVRETAKIAIKKGIPYLTLWALSTDNLYKREEKEIEVIIKLIDKIEDFLGEMLEEEVRLHTIGNIEKLPQTSREVLQKVKEKTKNNTKLHLTIALIYGGQDEIIRATKNIIQDGKNPEDITKEEFRNYLDTAFLPNPDLIVRTGGDVRHSGFLLFDSEYSEYYFTEKKWPEFDEEEFENAIQFFLSSKRNFGK